MKYYKLTVDDYLFFGINVTELSRILKINQSYLSRIKNGKHVASEKQYHRIKNVIAEHLTQLKR